MGSIDIANRRTAGDHARHRVVVVGGGFAGIEVVRGLRRAPVEVTLVDRQNFMLFQPLVYQVATGALKQGDKVPSVRELAATLAVNQNTILKVYNHLCSENVLRVERGDGTYVAATRQNISAAERKKAVAATLREAAVQAIHLDVTIEQAQELLEQEYRAIKSGMTGKE